MAASWNCECTKREPVTLTMYKIDDHVGKEFREETTYLLKLGELKVILQEEKALDVYCVHEAGHVIVFLKAGARESDFIYKRPTIYYNVEIKDFDYFPCAVKPTKRDELRTEADLESLARAAVAGGIFELELMKSINIGDTDDRDRFHEAYDEAVNQGMKVKRTEKNMWDWAQGEVTKELRAQALQAEGHERATDIRARCFQLDENYSVPRTALT